MVDYMTEDELNEIETRCNGTSRDNWVADVAERDRDWPGPFQLKGGIPLEFGWDGEEGIYGEKCDFEFIAHARQDIPLLISEIRKLKKQITKELASTKHLVR